MQKQLTIRCLGASTPSAITHELRITSTIEPIDAQAANYSHRLIRAELLPVRTAQRIQNQLQQLHGQAYLNPASASDPTIQTSDLLLSASLSQYHSLLQQLNGVELPLLNEFCSQLQQLLQIEQQHDRGTLQCGDYQFHWGQRTYIMGIINVTPDSFSADGLLQHHSDPITAALARAQQAADEGADILDIGGESTRPGAEPVSIEEETRRVVPAIQAIRQQIDLPISIDSYHTPVIAAALDAGAHIINDIWGLRTPNGGWNHSLAQLAAEREVPIMLMHNRNAIAVKTQLGGHFQAGNYRNLVGDIIRELNESIEFALNHGIAQHNIIIDPGLGFGKSPDQNLELFRRIPEFTSMGYPLLIAASRKSFIGQTLQLPPQERDEATVASTSLAIQAGADLVRVHNVKMNVRAARFVDALYRPTFAKQAAP
jgi:dihydropteroate synthase